MSLENEVMSAIKTAMKEKNKVALDSLRAIKSEIILAKTDGSGEEVTREKEIAILQRLVKQRKDSLEQYRAQGREDLATVEEAQLKEIEKFLPAQLSPEVLEQEIKQIISDTGANGMKDMGLVMKEATSKLAGKSDGKSIAQMVKKLLN